MRLVPFLLILYLLCLIVIIDLIIAWTWSLLDKLKLIYGFSLRAVAEGPLRWLLLRLVNIRVVNWARIGTLSLFYYREIPWLCANYCTSCTSVFLSVMSSTFLDLIDWSSVLLNVIFECRFANICFSSSFQARLKLWNFFSCC